MEIDANVNITIDVDDDEWESFLDQYREEDEDGNLELVGDAEDYLQEFVESLVDGEEIQGYSSTAWVCSVDSCSIL